MQKIILILAGFLVTTLSYASDAREGLVNQGLGIQFDEPFIQVDTSQVITCHFPKNQQLDDGALTMNFSSKAFTQTQSVTMSSYSNNLNQITFRPYLHLTDPSKTSATIKLEGSTSHSFRVLIHNKVKATQTTITCDYTRGD